MKSFRFLCLVILLLIGQARSTTRYVSTIGDNTNPGTEAQPWATPGYGSKQIAGGDTLIILGGTYILSEYWEDMITPPSGSADTLEGPHNYTFILGEQGNRPVLKGRNNLFSAVELSDKSWIWIDNLEICSDDGAFFREGVSASGQCEQIWLEDLYIHHMDEFGVDFQDILHLTVRRCDIRYCGFGAIGGPEGEAGGWRHASISECDLSYSGHYYQGEIGPGMGPYDRPDGLGLEPSDGPLSVLECRAEHNRGDGLDSKIKNTLVWNCIVANNTCDGIKLWGGRSMIVNSLVYGTGDGDRTTSTPWAALVIENTDEPDTEFYIVNTTLHQDPRKHGYMLYSQYNLPNPIKIFMTNTIVAGGSGSAYFGPSVTLNMDHCLIYREGESVQLEANGQEYTAQDIQNGLLGSGNLSADPMFMAPAWGTEGDYRLQAESPAVDAGTTHALADNTDLDGNPRPSGQFVDMGCYEYQYPVHVDQTSESASISPILYDPDRNRLEIQSDHPGRLIVYNLLGQTILNRDVEGSTILPVRASSGVYIAVLDVSGNRIVQRFTVIK